ncbi:hypothetical protein ACOMHN_055035 [Nucella lapillus]
MPFHVRGDVEKDLDRLEAMDIIEKVDGPTLWVGPIVVVQQKSGGVCVCVDMREANRAIKREKHPMPTLDDLILDLNGSTVFRKLDMKNVYHQLELDEPSRYITTFTTHAGLRRYKRLLLGGNAASPRSFTTILASGISHDIIVRGKTQAEHVQKKLSEKGARLQKEKCIFSVTEVTAYFSPAEPSKILVDASQVGLGAILTQKGNGISYASRALTPTGQRYSQTEKEMLAVVYGVEHFHLYLFGARFTVVTDHKLLLGMINSQKPATA